MIQLFMRSFSILALFVCVVLFAFYSPTFAQEILQGTAEEYRAKGYEAQQKGNLDQALICYSKAISLGNKTASIYNDLGVVYEQLGDQERAVASYEQAISQDPQYLSSYANLAYFYKEQGQTDKALVYFKERFERSLPDDPQREKFKDVILHLDPTYKDRIIKTELETTSQALQQKAKQNFDLDVARAERHFQQGQKYLAAKNYDKALVELDRALSLTPQNPKIIREKHRVVYEQQLSEVRLRTDAAIKSLDAGELQVARETYQSILAIIPSEPILNAEYDWPTHK